MPSFNSHGLIDDEPKEEKKAEQSRRFSFLFCFSFCVAFCGFSLSLSRLMPMKFAVSICVYMRYSLVVVLVWAWFYWFLVLYKRREDRKEREIGRAHV